MNELLLLLIGGAAALAVLRAPLRPATAVFLAGIIVVPTTLPLSLGPRWFALSRLLLWAYVAGLAIRWRRGEIPASAFRPTRVHAAFAAFLATAFLCGIVLVPPTAPRFESLLIWLTLADQALVLVAVLAAARLLGTFWVARIIAGLAAVLCVIALGERHFGLNWNHFFFEGTTGSFVAGSKELGERGGVPRVRGPSQFALEFGWVCAVLVPVVAVVVTRPQRLLARIVPPMLVLAAVWSVSRSAVIGVAVAVAVTVVASRLEARLTRYLLLGAAVAGVVLVLAGSLRDPFDAASPDSADSRVRRWVAITDAVEDRPLVGLGLAGPRGRGVLGTDTSYVLLYAAIGVIGLTMFAALLLTAAAVVARGLRGPPRDERSLAAGVLGSIVAGLIGTAFFDLFTVAGASRLFWALVAVGLSVAERAPGRTVGVAARPRSTLATRGLLPVAGVGVGLVLAATFPTHVATSASFDVFGVEAAQSVGRDPTLIGRTLINTTCELVDTVEAPGADIECWEPRRAATIGALRVESASPAALQRAVALVDEQLQRHQPEVRIFPIERLEEGRPTLVRTAPVWLGLAGLMAALLVPRRSRSPGPASAAAPTVRGAQRPRPRETSQARTRAAAAGAGA